ncbi:pyruvate dehydrogenase E1 component beta subunit [Mycobacterium sp. OAE908]|uniref:alpha-ketoacid dehydrogenase subunit beta n=1 Tax=Mycobacterium sp. OAE908 TaxID=2817899 RepID=UPI0034E2F58F
MSTGKKEMLTLPTVFAINQALDLAMEKDPTVFLLGEDISDPTGGGVYKATQGLSSKHGEHRVRATPISEQAILGAAIGAAVAGMRPVAEIMMMDFLTVCMDQLVNHAAKLRYMSGGQTGVPLTVRCSAGAGLQFGAQHSTMLESWLIHVPGLKVAIPSCAADAKGLLSACIFDDDPCVHIEQTVNYFVPGLVPSGEHVIPLGKADIKRPGADVSLISYGNEVNLCLQAAENLKAEGVDAEVVDLRTLVPLDERAVLESVAKTKRAVVVHQAVRRGGFGAELSALITENLMGELQAPPVRVASPNSPVPYAMELEQAFVPQVDSIIDGVRRVLK